MFDDAMWSTYIAGYAWHLYTESESVSCGKSTVTPLESSDTLAGEIALLQFAPCDAPGLGSMPSTLPKSHTSVIGLGRRSFTRQA